MARESIATVTPWEVKGDIDYQKLLKDFGVSPISKDLLTRITSKAGVLHPFLRRNIFFAHRDLKWILDEYDKGNKFYLYTGRAPSGPVHLGHIGVWQFCKWLQDVYDVELWFQFPDEEKFLFKQDMTFEETGKWTYDNMLDVIALGFDPKKTHFLIDTMHAHIMYKEGCKVAKRITASTVKSAFGLTDSDNVGKYFYTVMQAVPAFLPSILAGKKIPCLVPHAIDQDPHFRVSRDVIPKIGFDKPASIQCVFLPGLGGMSGDGKMSASDANSAIYMTDSPATVKKKINKYAFSGGRDTLEEHRKLGGNPDIDVSYQWLRFFEADDVKLKELYDSYKSGKLLSGELKAILIDTLNTFLAEHQKKREAAKSRIDEFVYKG